MTRTTMTPADLLAEVRKAMRKAPAGGVSARDYATFRKIPILRAREELRLLQASGKLVVGREQRPRLDGTMTQIPVYALKGK